MSLAAISYSKIAVKRQSPTGLACADLIQAINLSWFWMALGWQDVLQRYRGSVLGPFWLTITTGVFIVGLGPLYANLFSLKMADYLPHMALGVTTWNFISGTINDSCNTFIAAEQMMKQMRLPRMALLFRVVWRSMIAFLHNLPIYLAIFLWFEIPLTLHVLMVVPGFLLLCLHLIWIGLLVAILCARYRDITPIIGSLLQIGFFVTPVMWSPNLQAVNPLFVNLNPFAAFIELVRAPLLGYTISLPLLVLASASLPIGVLMAAFMFTRYRKQIVYWV